jgi:pyrroloquinoline-quinone synthase
MNTYLNSIDRQIAARHLLTHPFYIEWNRGTLRREALIDYVEQYYHHVAAFPTYLSAVHAGCDDQRIRKEILANLIDEEASEPSHPALWRRFAEAVRHTDANPGDTEQQPETKALIETFRSICRDGSTAEGLAALYAYESQIPTVSETKIHGLTQHYGINDPKAYEYFTVHAAADVEHSAAEQSMLEEEVSAENSDRVGACVDRVLNALWELLSGVCRRHAIAC